METVRGRIQAGDRTSGAQPNVDEHAPLARRVRSFDGEVYSSLHQAKLMTTHVQVNYTVGYRTPIIGQAWAVVRRRIHQEIRIYIDTIIDRQTKFNTHIARAVNSLVDNLDGMMLKERLSERRAQEEALSQLQAEMATLKERVRVMERRLSQSEGSQ